MLHTKEKVMGITTKQGKGGQA